MKAGPKAVIAGSPRSKAGGKPRSPSLSWAARPRNDAAPLAGGKNDVIGFPIHQPAVLDPENAVALIEEQDTTLWKVEVTTVRQDETNLVCNERRERQLHSQRLP